MLHELIWVTPEGDAETPLRVRPLREHWEARGPGMLKRFRDLIPWIEIPSKINVHLQNPIAGAGGRVVSDNELEFSAVLANPIPQLPEVTRLAWLCGILGIIRDGELRPVDGVAAIPLTLAVAEYVELAEFNVTTTQIALQEWVNSPMSGDSPMSANSPISATELMDWWEHHRGTIADRDAWRSTTASLG